MSREKGDKLEDKVSFDLGINRTTNSGAKWDNADLTNKKLIIECKFKDKPFISNPNSEIKKLIKQASKHNKDWLYIQQNQGGTFAVMDYNLFLELYKKATDE